MICFHPDRNHCRVDEHTCVKVADFGLSRDLRSSDYYRGSPGKHMLPVRWMAPECHTEKVFTTQSDVVRRESSINTDR